MKTGTMIISSIMKTAPAIIAAQSAAFVLMRGGNCNRVLHESAPFTVKIVYITAGPGMP